MFAKRCHSMLFIFAIACLDVLQASTWALGLPFAFPQLLPCRSNAWSICASTPQRNAVDQSFESPRLHSVNAKSTQLSLRAFRCLVALWQVTGAPASQPQCGSHSGRRPTRDRPNTAASMSSLMPTRIPACFQRNMDLVWVVTRRGQLPNIMRLC